MSKVETMEKDIVEASIELNSNKDVNEIHKEQNHVENHPLENVESEEGILQPSEIEQEAEAEQSDAAPQEEKDLSEASETDDALEKVAPIIDRLEEGSAENSNETIKSDPIVSSPTIIQNMVDELSVEKHDKELKQEEENQEPNRDIDESKTEILFQK